MSDKGPDLERGIWAAVIIAALIVILRVFAKNKISRFHVDDVLMIIASVGDLHQLILEDTHQDFHTNWIGVGLRNSLNGFPDFICSPWLWYRPGYTANARHRAHPEVYRNPSPHRHTEHHHRPLLLHHIPRLRARHEPKLPDRVVDSHGHPAGREYRLGCTASEPLQGRQDSLESDYQDNLWRQRGGHQIRLLFEQYVHLDSSDRGYT